MTTIKPVIIPREAADRIEGLRSSALSNERIVDVYVSEGRGTPPSTRGIRSISFDTLLTALVVGYERELTEEEAREKAYAEIAETYERHANGPLQYRTEAEDSAYVDGMQYVLNALGLEITTDAEGGAA
jgi:3-deoxy-D-arabino-heptulosonate 7-phosphate (DAHP) synthase class II